METKKWFVLAIVSALLVIVGAVIIDISSFCFTGLACVALGIIGIVKALCNMQD